MYISSLIKRNHIVATSRYRDISNKKKKKFRELGLVCVTREAPAKKYYTGFNAGRSLSAEYFERFSRLQFRIPY